MPIEKITDYIQLTAAEISWIQNAAGSRGDTEAINETPTGIIDSSNKDFTLAHTPNPATSLKLFLNGAYQTPAGEDYTLTTATIVFVNAPPAESILKVFYSYDA